jgi:arylsulfatase A-like enzyme
MRVGVPFNGGKIDVAAARWPRLLAAAGYQVFYTGKWHQDGVPRDHGFTAGGNIHVGGSFDHFRSHVIQFDESKGKGAGGVVDKFSSELFVDTGLDFIDRAAGKPWCLVVAFTAMHDPWVSPEPFASMYDPAKMQPRVNFMPRPPFTIPENFAKIRDQAQLPFPVTPESVKTALANYRGQVSHLDAQVGRLLKGLRDRSLTERTAVIFTASQGYSMGSHGVVAKQTMYEEGIRVPLIVRLPAAKPCVIRQLVSHVDIFPTICQLAGMTMPDVEGRSLLPLLNGGDPPDWRTEIFASFHSPTGHQLSTRAIRTANHKLIRHLLTNEAELFDLRTDPYEMTNRIDDPAYVQVKAQLSASLDAWRRQVDGR